MPSRWGGRHYLLFWDLLSLCMFICVRSQMQAFLTGLMSLSSSFLYHMHKLWGWLGSQVVSILDSGTEGPGFKFAAAMLSGNSLRQTVHTHHASVHQAAKLVAALLRIARATAGLAESNGSLRLGLWLTSPAGWLPRTGISCGTLRSVIEYGLPLVFFLHKLWSVGTDVLWSVCHLSVCLSVVHDRELC